LHVYFWPLPGIDLLSLDRIAPGDPHDSGYYRLSCEPSNRCPSSRVLVYNGWFRRLSSCVQIGKLEIQKLRRFCALLTKFELFLSFTRSSTILWQGSIQTAHSKSLVAHKHSNRWAMGRVTGMSRMFWTLIQHRKACTFRKGSPSTTGLYNSTWTTASGSSADSYRCYCTALPWSQIKGNNRKFCFATSGWLHLQRHPLWDPRGGKKWWKKSKCENSDRKCHFSGCGNLPPLASEWNSTNYCRYLWQKVLLQNSNLIWEFPTLNVTFSLVIVGKTCIKIFT